MKRTGILAGVIISFSIFNFQFSISAPRDVRIDSMRMMRAVDSIVTAAIEAHAFPGCQLFVARGGKTEIDKSFGHHDYSCKTPVENDHLYDLASVTKMAASTIALARLADQRAIDLDDRLSKFYPPLRATDKGDITFREVLSHRSGLPSGIPRPWLFTRDSLLAAICSVAMRTPGLYRYSDLPFLLVPQIVRTADRKGRDFETFLAEEFYHPMETGLVFNPLGKGVPPEKIVPTEEDTYWRGTPEVPVAVHGTVHDESAAVLGGVSGNAGLFGSARDLAAVMQMLLDGGLYDGVRYLSPRTIDIFTSRHYPAEENRRALGFDRPLPGNDTLPFDEAYPAPAVSQSSFGHTGFTGTFAWADPEFDLVYVFLCNRVTPSRRNEAFVDTRVRYALQQAVYEALHLSGEASRAESQRGR
ncbi:MAG: beta-lactamase family protein [Alistipes sp.]|jgi:CubicO group peptidase (beta-lactamase class C family)|nr:beta-lactamase family protein [Alistipes sp.]